MIFEGRTMGKEQLILLPVDGKAFRLPTGPGTSATLSTGRQAIVVSGIAGIYLPGYSTGAPPGFFLRDVDDDDTFTDEVHFLVGPRWGRVVQVSAMVSPAGITSHDSDEVDHSAWVLTDCTWEFSDSPEHRIRLKVTIQTQGSDNGWVTLAYQVVATGDMPWPTPGEISTKVFD
jgi:hypothetical protein